MMKTGIYCIEHVESGKKYIGSAVDFDKRWGIHRHHLRKGKHHSIHLQRAWDKYGEPAFEFKILLFCSKENLIMYEQRCIDGYEVCNSEKGYNCAPLAGSTLGCRPSPEALARQRAGFAKRLNHPHSEETKKKIGAAHKGRVYGTKFREDRRVGRASKLNPEKAAEIRAMYAAGDDQDVIAAIYGVVQQTVSDVVRGRSWAPILPGTTSGWRKK